MDAFCGFEIPTGVVGLVEYRNLRRRTNDARESVTVVIVVIVVVVVAEAKESAMVKRARDFDRLWLESKAEHRGKENIETLYTL